MIIIKNFVKRPFFTHLFIPLAALTIYSLILSTAISKLLEPGVTSVFLGWLWKIALGMLVVSSLLFLFLQRNLERGEVKKKRSTEQVETGDWLLLFLPLTSVFQFVVLNQDVLSLIDSALVMILSAIISVVFILIIPVMIRGFSSARVMTTLGAAFMFSVMSMPIFSLTFSWFEKGNLLVQLLVFALVFGLCTLGNSQKNKRMFHLILLGFFTINGIVNLSIAKPYSDYKENERSQNALLTAVNGRSMNEKPNVYLLVYDSYVANETMLAHGIDNRGQEDFLEERGFVFYPQTYSVGADTISSMSRVLNASVHFYGRSRSAVAGNGIVQEVFKNSGYTTFGVFPTDYMFKGGKPSYDVDYPKKATSSFRFLLSAVLVGEFRYDLEFTDLTHVEYVHIKQALLEDLGDEPRFFYSHSNLPGHTQISGKCQPNETRMFSENLADANTEMKKDVEIILQADPGAVIIIAGDHGPHLTKNCSYLMNKYDAKEIDRLDIQDRHGSFLAIRWPNERYEQYDQISVLQDVFPAVFAYLYGDERILDSEIAPLTIDDYGAITSEVYVENGIIHGGKDDGEELFLSGE